MKKRVPLWLPVFLGAVCIILVSTCTFLFVSLLNERGEREELEKSLSQYESEHKEEAKQLNIVVEYDYSLNQVCYHTDPECTFMNDAISAGLYKEISPEDWDDISDLDECPWCELERWNPDGVSLH